jgi:DNA-binding MarR family transcriptional regulator
MTTNTPDSSHPPSPSPSTESASASSDDSSVPLRDQQIDAVLHFGRFYMRRIEISERGMLRETSCSRTEARALAQLAKPQLQAASSLADALLLDRGYLTRILRKLDARGLIIRRPSPLDGRMVFLSLSEEGKRASARIGEVMREGAGHMLDQLEPSERVRMLDAMETIEDVLESRWRGDPP